MKSSETLFSLTEARRARRAVSALTQITFANNFRKLEAKKMSWTPSSLKVGDQVVNPANEKWGIGIVQSEYPLAELPISPRERIILHPKTIGQRAVVKFADGRTRTIITPNTPLKIVK